MVRNAAEMVLGELWKEERQGDQKTTFSPQATCGVISTTVITTTRLIILCGARLTIEVAGSNPTGVASKLRHVCLPYIDGLSDETL